jgi:outer membrane beta-barrel protein
MTLLARASLLLATLAALPAVAQVAPPPAAGSDQVIVPEVQRREVHKPHYGSNDFSLSLFAGSYQAQNFGSSGVTGLRLGYHVTEDVFVEASVARTRVNDNSFRQILPGGVFPTPTQTLSYYDVVAGYNVLSGEAFFGRNTAKVFQGYLLAGVGNTTLVQQKHQTIVLGFGVRVVLTDHVVLQTDLREHMYSLDLLGQRQSTRNPEVSAALTFYF